MTRLNLPPGYRWDDDPCAPRLYRPSGKLVAGWGPSWSPRDVEKAAWDDHRRVEAAIADVEGKLKIWRERQ